MFSTPEIPETSSTQPAGSAQNSPNRAPIGTPKMSVLFKDSNNIRVVFFGKLGFLDDQSDFAEVFGNKPTILVLNITTLQDSTSKSRSLYSFA